MSQNPTPGNSSPLKELTGRIGKYEIVKPLGKGAMGIVYLAHDTVLERDVALKVMVAQIADDPELLDRFRREAKAVAKMAHPNVVNVFDLGNHTDGSPYIAMELLKGQDLQKALRGSPISLDRKLAIIVQVLAGLAHAHESGIVHRDIKPANIFINADGTVKIMDFGVARLTTASMTGTGNIVGTADYMSPEQVKGAKVDGRSDLFSVGCMLFELLTGQRPFHSDNLMAIFYKITHEEANFASLPAGKEYEELLPILKKALAKTIDDRYQTAYEFATDLREYLKVHATSRSGQHALQEVMDIAPPKHRPEPLTDAPGATVVQAGTNEVASGTMDVGPTRIDHGTQRGTPTVKASAPTVAGGRTLGQSPTVVAAGGRAPRPYPQSPRRPIEEPGSKTGLFVGIGVVVLAAAVGGYFVLKPGADDKQAAATPAPTAAPTAAVTEAPTAAPTVVATAAATVAPTPTLPPSAGKAAAFLKEAQAALGRGDYDRAMKQAQAALGEDASNVTARDLVDRALNGQKATTHFRAAETALDGARYAEAQQEAERGRSLAPWDARGTDLLSRVHEAQRRQQQAAEKARQDAERTKAAEASARVADMLGRAAVELASSRFDAAIELYREILKVDPGNKNALDGLTNAASAKAAANTNRLAAGKRFVVGDTKAQSAETKGSSGPDGFDVPVGMEVKKGSQATELPGKIGFEVSPESPSGGSPYTVRIIFRNEGAAPIQIESLLVTTVINGKRIGPHPLTAQVKDAAPRSRVVLFPVEDFWREDIKSWVMEAKVTTSRRETYTNSVVWQ